MFYEESFIVFIYKTINIFIEKCTYEVNSKAPFHGVDDFPMNLSTYGMNF